MIGIGGGSDRYPDPGIILLEFLPVRDRGICKYFAASTATKVCGLRNASR